MILIDRFIRPTDPPFFPFQALAKHVADPWAVNVATNGVSIPGL